MNYNTSDIFGGSYNASAHYDAVKVQLDQARERLAADTARM